jgi:diacylglycerol kinase family enzyme
VMVGRTDPYTFYKEHGLRMTPDASLDKGLDVLSVRKLNRRNVPRIAWQVFGSARHVHGRDIDYVHDASRVSVSSATPFPVQVDGDPMGDHRELSMELAREALWVVA